MVENAAGDLVGLYLPPALLADILKSGFWEVWGPPILSGVVGALVAGLIAWRATLSGARNSAEAYQDMENKTFLRRKVRLATTLSSLTRIIETLCLLELQEAAASQDVEIADRTASVCKTAVDAFSRIAVDIGALEDENLSYDLFSVFSAAGRFAQSFELNMDVMSARSMPQAPFKMDKGHVQEVVRHCDSIKSRLETIIREANLALGLPQTYPPDAHP